MKKVFRIEEVDCAHCAQKIEDAIAAIDGVTRVRLNFLSQRLTLEADDSRFDAIVKQAIKVSRRIEPDCAIIG